MTDDAKAAAFAAFEKAYAAYPSQDNEGYIPERGGFKCGWFAGVAWAREQDGKQIACEDYLVIYHPEHPEPGESFVAEFVSRGERIKELEAELEKWGGV